MAAPKKQNSYPRMVADDNGYADHKLAWFDEQEKIMTHKIPSIIQLGGQGLTTGTGEALGAYKQGDYDYHCSPGVSNPLATRTPDYPTSVSNRVLLTHALTKIGMLGVDVDLAVTLPFREFFKTDGTINLDLREASAKNFMQNDVKVVGKDLETKIQSVAVYAEALSAWFDWAIAENGAMNQGFDDMNDMGGEMLVVDVGGSTTDLACVQLVEGRVVLQHAKSGTNKLGVLDAKDRFEELVRAEMTKEGIVFAGHDSKIPPVFLNVVFEKGGGNWSGKSWDFKKQRDQACFEIAERISAFIKERAGDPNMFYSILVVGGGAVVFKAMLEKLFGNAEFSDEFANARGALKVMRDKRNNAAGA